MNSGNSGMELPVVATMPAAAMMNGTSSNGTMMPVMQPNLFPLPARSGKMVAVLGDLYTFLVSTEETGGAFATLEKIIRPQNGPPPHIHHGNDETLYVMEGTFAFLVGEQTIQAETGTYVYVPRGTVHTFTNIGAAAGRLLVTVTPSGFEKYFEEIGKPVHSREEAFAINEAPDIARLMALAPAYQLEFRMAGIPK